MEQDLLTKYFEAKYVDDSKIKAAFKKPGVKKTLKAKFYAVIFDNSKKISTFEEEREKLCEDFEDIDINRLLEIEDEIEFLKEDREKIRKLYLSWIGKEMKNIDDDED